MALYQSYEFKFHTKISSFTVIVRPGRAIGCGFDAERYQKKSPTEPHSTTLRSDVGINGFKSAWKTVGEAKIVSRKISELNLSTINASASGSWQIKTVHKNHVWLCAVLQYVKIEDKIDWFLELSKI